MIKRFVLLGLLVLLAGASFADSKEKEAGKTQIRVVSLSPCLTELVFHLGEQGKLVGRSSACDYPEAAQTVECVGAFGKPSLEKLFSVKPTVVIASALKDPAIKTSIEQFGVKFYLLPTDSISSYYQTVATLGKILGCEKKANAEIARVRKGLVVYKTQAETDKKTKPTVYLEIWDRPYMTVGKKSFINDLIAYAGGNNIAAKQDKAYFNCSVEWIISSNPDIIICPAMRKGREANVTGRKGWQTISAVKNGRIYVDLDDDLIYRLGPRILEGIEMLKKLIQEPPKTP